MPVILNPAQVKIHSEIAPLLDQARKTFIRGVKLTLIVRVPNDDGQDVIVSDDTLDEVNKVIQRKIAAGKR